MITVACVLKSGGDYGPPNVYRLRDAVKKHLRIPHQFVCLTDLQLECDTLRLLRNWPGWWSKIELFDGRLSGPIFYLDLDTIPVGNLDDLACGHQFTVLENFWVNDYKDPQRIGSGLMAWDMNLTSLYQHFMLAPVMFMRSYKTKEKWGDQAFIKEFSPVKLDRWQWKYPGRVVSFKKHVVPNKGIPKDASVVCFHGLPRPWQILPEQKRWFNVDHGKVSV